ncbi:hypothetical protein APY04_1462 [Hyphomicrobium sulfonivorans]|uniref:Uncharacterized protein n=1 Tax=Hyphomicrobium sulfonivorans TaxID=121290 RepID=A0A109BID3_HYPSL|nr:hypothetical protein APY04_1462 [Hyphomicrobium sulfonivorans]
MTCCESLKPKLEKSEPTEALQPAETDASIRTAARPAG